ncbi:MAG: hypothetical protein JNN07_24405 [Verrucomicrobiales bacterium]|nr:hypothetical protein [Verrucomicrobiales bacterium]
MKASRTAIVASTLPGVMMLGLFYSLAFHMHRSLGGWPMSIGERDFPASLIAHAYLTTYFFIGLIWFGMFVVPVAMLACLLRPRWRRSLRYWALYALVFCLCWGLMQLAPEPFLYWWRD